MDCQEHQAPSNASWIKSSEACHNLCQNTYVYLDDILVHSPDEEAHKPHLLDRLSAAGVTLCDKKCKIGMKIVDYLGHVFSAQGMTPDPSKILAVQEWPVPSNITDV